jgi:hypothetical protein
MAASVASVHRGKGYLSLSGNNGEENQQGHYMKAVFILPVRKSLQKN